MKTINLREYDRQAYPKDTWIEASDEVAETFLLAKRKEAARDRQMYRYKAFYSLACDDGIEKAAIHWAQPSPEEILLQKEAEQHYQLTLIRLAEALDHLPEKQARRIRARYLMGRKIIEIAAQEEVVPSCVGTSIKAGLKNIRKYFEKRNGKYSDNGNTGTIESRTGKSAEGIAPVGEPPENSAEPAARYRTPRQNAAPEPAA